MTTRVAHNPITVPKGVEIKVSDSEVNVKGPKGTLSMSLHPKVQINREEDIISIALKDNISESEMKFAGTCRANLNNMVIGVTNGYEKKLILEGTGYRAQTQGSDLKLMVGHSHDDIFPVPKGISIECPDNKNITVKGIDKQLVGQVSANIRDYRPPEPYKGKGIRYSDEVIARKEVKKK